MTSYLHSGTLGDLIYGLWVIKSHREPADFYVALENLEAVVQRYGYRPDEVDPAHRSRFTEQDYLWLKPLLERQDYIGQAMSWRPGQAEPDVDLDRFRGTLFRGFEGNYLEAYRRAFGLEFTDSMFVDPWLQADPTPMASVVISRTARYRDPQGSQTWRDLVQDIDLESDSVFLGTPEEHREFQGTVGRAVPYHPVADFLELANIVAGANLVMANFVFSLAMGLGKDAVLETIKIKPLKNNECWFPRPNVQYW